MKPELSVACEVNANAAAVTESIIDRVPTQGHISRFEPSRAPQDVFEQLAFGSLLGSGFQRHQTAATATRRVGTRRRAPRGGWCLQLELLDLDVALAFPNCCWTQRITRERASNQRYSAVLEARQTQTTSYQSFDLQRRFDERSCARGRVRRALSAGAARALVAAPSQP